MGKSSAEIDRGPPQGAAEVSAKLPPAALESTLHLSCMYHNVDPGPGLNLCRYASSLVYLLLVIIKN